MAVEWVIPLGSAAFQNREEIKKSWTRVLDWLRGKKTCIAFTGAPGVGKTVLLDHLTGKAFEPGYQPPEPSQFVEKEKLARSRRRIAIAVLPGQRIETRFVGIEELFERKPPVAGVVHVACNGFADLRGTYSQDVLRHVAGVKTLADYRQRQLDAELTDLDATCEIVRQAVRKYRAPNWLFLAVTKADLFYDTLDEVRAYYLADPASPFVSRLEDLTRQSGSDNIRWAAQPVCCWLEPFEWNKEQVASQLREDERDQLLGCFAKALESFCEPGR